MPTIATIDDLVVSLISMMLRRIREPDVGNTYSAYYVFSSRVVPRTCIDA